VTIDFRSDNTHGASPEVLSALALNATGTISSYGNDPITARLRERCRSLFETDLEIFPLLTGTAGNSLSIAATTPPWGAVFCHEDAHIHRDEMGAPEFFTSGAKLIPVPGADGKMRPADLEKLIVEIGGEGRTAKPACVSLTQATEAGTVYSAAETRALADVAHRYGCRVHVDGARFANAVAATGASLADLTWRAGVDLLVFGATKNGALAAELIVLFDKSLAAELTTRIHRAGHRLSKMRLISAQFEGYLADQAWLKRAQHANAMAARLAAGIEGEILRRVDANIVFARFAPERLAALRERGFLFYDWPIFGAGAVRLVTGWSTTEADVDALVAATKS
jgi:threonine aldolase